MKNIKLDSILLFALVIPFIMTYRISPGDTPFGLFGIIFLGLLLYIVLDITKIKDNLYFKLKHIILWLIIVTVIGSAFLSAIIVRHNTAPSYMIHDIILQQESAIRFFLDGKNPYAVTYFGTPLEQWNYSATEINPALYHFVMQPFYLLFALPFYVLSNSLLGFFDGRIPLLFLFLMLLVFADILTKDKDKKLLFLIMLAFNPSILGYTLEGRSDIFMFAFLFLGFYFLYTKKYFSAGIPIALAFVVKQSAWPILPFYFAFIYFKNKNISKTLRDLVPFVITFIAIIFPFLLWNQKAFLDSTIFYLSGTTIHSYPISGYGLGMLLSQIGVIKDLHQYYPFILWQAIIGMPLIAGLIFYLKKSPSVGRLILVYGIFLFIFWYLSRYFNNSHLGYLSVVFITAYFWPKDNN
ncbi:MAG: glycosyltransferase 87 family protein [Candidatus Levybacteria bacterium]|nr:glycosyltransferase 87 family protein [Candidatus Levybacteria bacterium]